MGIGDCRCSFCSAGIKERTDLFKGNGALICERCVLRCLDVLTDGQPDVAAKLLADYVRERPKSS